MGYKTKKDYSYTKVDDPSIVKEEVLHTSTIEDIDTALYNFVNDSMNIFATSNKGFKKIPVIWTSAERSFQLKDNTELRDNNGNFILPVITMERTNISKELGNKGGVWGNMRFPGAGPGGEIEIARRIVQDKTSDNAATVSKRLYGQQYYPHKNEKVVYETITVPMPVYITVDYSVKIRTEYLQQMNSALEPFINLGVGINYLVLRHHGHSYEVFIQEGFSTENNASNLGEEERKYETKIDMKILGYLLGAGPNQRTPRIKKRQNFVSVSIGRERIVTGDKPETLAENYVDFRD